MIFLGVFDPNLRYLPEEEIAALQKAITRVPQELATFHQKPNFSLLVVDDLAYSNAFALEVADTHIGLVSGRPYIDVTDTRRDANVLLEALREDDHALLRKARGSFCALSFDVTQGLFRLCSDKVGIYPVYVARIGTRVYFASALRMLRMLPGPCEQIDIEGLFDSIAFGFPLARRTAYSKVERMYGGEVVRFGLTVEPSIDRYWKWDEVATEPASVKFDELSARIYKHFVDAVTVRISDSAGDLSFLSGGLDSRCIVAALRELERPVWSLNFAPKGTQDHLFGRLAGKRLGSTHFELDLNRGSFPQRQHAILDSWARSYPEEVAAGVNPKRVWSGDGGSVGLGHVYLDETFVEQLRNSKVVNACAHFMHRGKHVVPSGMLQKQWQSLAKLLPQQTMCTELSSFSTADPAKAGLLFLLLNDQRNHLNDYFENLDLYRFELVLPFFDAQLLEAVVAAPLDWFLRHRFYSRWLHEFPQGITEVPWQAYPGHMPCPIPSDGYGGLRYQWNEGWSDLQETEQQFRASLQQWDQAIKSDIFPVRLLNRPKVQFAWWMTRLKVRDYSYLLRSAYRVFEATQCEGFPCEIIA